MKTLATFSKPEEAHLFRLRLEAVGIPAFVQDEHIVQMNWLWSNVVGGVRVQVTDDEIEEAREFLATDKPQPRADSDDVLCPSCGSHETAPDEFPRRVAFLCILVVWFPLFLGRYQWRCSACRCVFNVPPRSFASLS